MKKFIAMLLLASFVFAGVVTVVGCGDPPKPIPPVVKDKDKDAKDKDKKPS